MKRVLALLALAAAVVVGLLLTASAEQLIVADGEARGRIVIAEQPPRAVSLAAAELQTYLERISGARLEVATAPDEDDDFTVYVGRSQHTDELGIEVEGLDYGAFRMTTGDGWLALIGNDYDFELPEPRTMQPHADHPDTIKMLEEWDAISGGTYVNPIGGPGLRRQFSRALDLWAYDGCGSLNAVYAFLGDLGVRWYMPGELGEIVPQMETIAVAPMDEAVRPAFAWRQVHFARFGSTPEEEILWYLRQGFNHDDVVGHYSHGLREVMGRPEMKAAYPGYYALIGGQRWTQGQGQPCLSSEGLIEETVRFARALYDTYDVPMVSVMPQDGFRFCQCELCEGKDSPERGRLGVHSDYVWNFVERVATELYQSHPDKKVHCGAYGTYTLPPTNIDEFSPNVVALFVHGRGKRFHFPAEGEQELVEGLPSTHPAFWSGNYLVELRTRWLKKLHNPMLNWEHYVFTHRGTFLPVYFPRAIAAGLASMDGHVSGEFVEVAFGPWEERGMGLHEPGFNHLNVYVTGRYYWNPQQDIDELLAEYYTLFYGAAAQQMQEFVDFCEIYWPDMNNNPQLIQAVIERIDAAVAAAPPGSPYAQRVQLVDNYLQPLRFQLNQLQRGREDAPKWRLLAWDSSPPELDGRLDDPAWQNMPTIRLVDPATGKRAEPETTARIFWRGGRLGGELWVAIRCAEPDVTNAVAASSTDSGPHLLTGDYVSILIETQGHSFYEIAVNPAGVLVDVDHQGQQRNFDWTSMATAAVHHDEDFWSTEIRIPIPGADTLGDPLHEIAGRRPTLDFPWFVNVVRQRFDNGQQSVSSWTTSDDTNPYDPMAFGKLGARR